jgi:hypothetical protein
MRVGQILVGLFTSLGSAKNGDQFIKNGKSLEALTIVIVLEGLLKFVFGVVAFQHFVVLTTTKKSKNCDESGKKSFHESLAKVRAEGLIRPSSLQNVTKN